MRLVALLMIPVAALLGCAAHDADGPPELGVRVQWLTGSPSASLPDDVQRIRVIRTIEGETLDVVISVENFEMGPQGQSFAAPALLSGLPTGVPIDISVEGLRAGDAVGYFGHIPTLVLAAGQRVYVDLLMYEIGASTSAVVQGTPAVFLHGATPLPDGRVLISGGFDTVTALADCPGGLPAMTRCFDLTATDRAWVFDPGTGRFLAIEGGMLEARAGHTATTLPGGRVLIAGGAPAGILGLVPVGGDTSNGYEPVFLPRLSDGMAGAHASFEIFLADANREEEDVDGDGDPGRGAFTGSAADASTAGRLNEGRFLHAAAATMVSDANRVVLFGGSAGDGSASTYEVYDDRKAGGYGVYDNAGALMGAAHPIPGAVEVGTGQVWVFGGGGATNNAALAEVWTPNPTAVNGDIAAGTSTDYPGAGDHPEYSLAGPRVAVVGTGGSHALAVGWFGPVCPAGGSTPAFDGTELCQSMGGPPRSQTVAGETGETGALDTSAPHAFSGIATMDDGRVAITGGAANRLWTPQPSIEIFTGAVSGGVAELATQTFFMRNPRSMHTTTPLPNNGMMSVGGWSIGGDAMTVTIQTTAEVLYLP